MTQPHWLVRLIVLAGTAFAVGWAISLTLDSTAAMLVTSAVAAAAWGYFFYRCDNLAEDLRQVGTALSLRYEPGVFNAGVISGIVVESPVEVSAGFGKNGSYVRAVTRFKRPLDKRLLVQSHGDTVGTIRTGDVRFDAMYRTICSDKDMATRCLNDEVRDVLVNLRAMGQVTLDFDHIEIVGPGELLNPFEQTTEAVNSSLEVLDKVMRLRRSMFAGLVEREDYHF